MSASVCSAASQDLPSMSEEEQALLSQLHTKKQAAESVFRALQRAEHAATAAATASGKSLFAFGSSCTLRVCQACVSQVSTMSTEF